MDERWSKFQLHSHTRYIWGQKKELIKDSREHSLEFSLILHRSECYRSQLWWYIHQVWGFNLQWKRPLPCFSLACNNFVNTLARKDRWKQSCVCKLYKALIVRLSSIYPDRTIHVCMRTGNFTRFFCVIVYFYYSTNLMDQNSIRIMARSSLF